MINYKGRTFTGERSLYKSNGIKIENCKFGFGESPLKESGDITLTGSEFGWKYPLWYCRGVNAENCVFTEDARAGIWYTDKITVKSSVIRALKNFRRCDGVSLIDVEIPNAEETLWSCKNVRLEKVKVNGSYFAMNCRDVYADGLELDGGYCFDGAQNVTVKNSKLKTKDAFWNAKNVVVENSFISCQYLGWNSENLTFINCDIESEQGLCYVKGLKLVNCRLKGPTLAFEFSSDIDAEITGRVESVFNPISGRITADEIGELITEKDIVSEENTVISCGNIGKISDKPEWKR